MEKFLRNSGNKNVVNIVARADAGNEDQFYRYTMPRLTLKHEGRGKNARTVIENLKSVAKSLRTSPVYIAKFISVKHGARTNVDKKSGAARVKGTHSARDLAELVQDFIEMFVLCGDCRKPELVIHVDIKRKSVEARCATCGWTGELGAGHKVSRYMLKNPPTKAQAIEWANHKPTNGSSDNQSANTEYVPMRGAVGVGAVGAQQLPDANDNVDANANANDDFDDENVWHIDTSESAAKERRNEEMKAMGVEDDESVVKKPKKKDRFKALGCTGERLAAFRELIASRNCENADEDLAKAIMSVAKLEGYDVMARTVFEFVFDSSIPHECKERVEVYQDVLRQVVTYNGGVHGVDNIASEVAFLKELELHLQHPKLARRVPIFLLELYNLDIVGEDALMAWWSTGDGAVNADAASGNTDPNAGGGNAVRNAAASFIEWLQNAEESDEESNDDDSE